MYRAILADTLHKKYIENENLTESERIESYDTLVHTAFKMYEYFGNHENIMISVSGGSDSDCIVHYVCTYFPEMLYKCHFVFVDTGLEYAATKRHLCYLEKKYSIVIQRIRGVSVVTSCRKYGFPILSKFKSQMINLYIRDCASGYRVIFENHAKSFHAMEFTESQKKLAVYLKENGILVSDKCCTVSKKKPLNQYQKKNKIDLCVTGERKSEGGIRSLSHKSCFERKKDIDKFMPLFWWSDEVKETFKAVEGIQYSDCYEVWGMKRTGCVGCPFNLNIGNDLEKMKQYEPNLYKACMNVFGLAYELTDKFNCRRKKCLPEKKEGA